MSSGGIVFALWIEKTFIAGLLFPEVLVAGEDLVLVGFVAGLWVFSGTDAHAKSRIAKKEIILIFKNSSFINPEGDFIVVAFLSKSWY